MGVKQQHFMVKFSHYSLHCFHSLTLSLQSLSHSSSTLLYLPFTPSSLLDGGMGEIIIMV